MAYTIKKLEKSDLKKYLSSLIETYENLSKIGDLTLEKAEEVFDKMQRKGSIVFVALDPENGITGLGTLLIEQKFWRAGAECGHIEDIVVRDGFQGQGIGSKILNAIMDELQNHNCYKVILDCEENLVSYYEKFGFKDDGVFMRKYTP